MFFQHLKAFFLTLLLIFWKVFNLFFIFFNEISKIVQFFFLERRTSFSRATAIMNILEYESHFAHNIIFYSRDFFSGTVDEMSGGA